MKKLTRQIIITCVYVMVLYWIPKLLIYQLPLSTDTKEQLSILALAFLGGIAAAVFVVRNRKKRKENKKREDAGNRKFFLDQFQTGGGND
ncbi:MAG: hypothetical protein LBK12_07595 [Odoribacteraceae bacterium]|nr:hypothetical protein [Odoribacteraceae bacterium]